MHSFNDFDLSEYYKINNTISDISSFKDISSKILLPLSQIIGAETSIFAVLKKTDKGVFAHNLLSNSVDDNSRKHYEQTFQNNDPILPHAFNETKANHNLGLSKSFSFALDNIIDFPQFSRGEYYNEFLRPNSLRHILAMGIPSGTDSSLVYVLGFHRYCNNAFKKKDAQVSSYFGPVIYNSFNNLELKNQLSDHKIISSYLKKQTSDIGLIILDETHKVVFANNAGQKHLCIKQGSADDYSDLDNDLVTKLAAYIPNINKTSTENIEFDHKDVKISARINVSDIKSLRNRIILNTHTLSHSDINIMEMEKYGLTLREIDISNLIMKGTTSPQISEKLCISIRTVENHLRSIYSKTGVNNRTSLAYKLTHSQNN